VQLKNGIIIADGVRVPFRLANMKFGLTAYPARSIEVIDRRIVVGSEADSSGIGFDEDHVAFTLCGAPHCAKEYRFTRF